MVLEVGIRSKEMKCMGGGVCVGKSLSEGSGVTNRDSATVNVFRLYYQPQIHSQESMV